MTIDPEKAVVDVPRGGLDRESVVPAARILAFSTLGHKSSDADRLRELLSRLDAVEFPFDRSRKARMFFGLLGEIRRRRPALVVMEGTGIAGGLALIIGRLVLGCRYVVSSGDAVGPWVGAASRWLGPFFGLYERVLCRLSSGFIGWTPYLVGRALTFGAPRGMTAAGWAPFSRTPAQWASDRRRLRERLSIPPENLVVGIAGTLKWSGRRRYCYGMELIEAARRIARADVTFLIVGDGDGRARLEALAVGLPPGRVVFVGRVPREELPAYYATMDAGSLPQSVDGVGSFRYTTKLSEYLAFGLPIFTGRIPLAYDLDDGWIWRLQGEVPWSPEYVDSLAAAIDSAHVLEVRRKQAAVPVEPHQFDLDSQVRRVTSFLDDLLAG